MNSFIAARNPSCSAPTSIWRFFYQWTAPFPFCLMEWLLQGSPRTSCCPNSWPVLTDVSRIIGFSAYKAIWHGSLVCGRTQFTTCRPQQYYMFTLWNPLLQLLKVARTDLALPTFNTTAIIRVELNHRSCHAHCLFVGARSNYSSNFTDVTPVMIHAFDFLCSFFCLPR